MQLIQWPCINDAITGKLKTMYITMHVLNMYMPCIGWYLATCTGCQTSAPGTLKLYSYKTVGVNKPKSYKNESSNKIIPV